MMLTLRPYQQAAVNAVYDHLRQYDDNPCIVAPTGSGKAIIIAKIATDAVQLWGGRVLVLAHVAELIEQNAEKIRRLAPGIEVGIYSAGLNRRDTTSVVIVASIQSLFHRADELGPFDLILIDEAHLIGVDGEGMYRHFLDGARVVNPKVRILGLTATPYRLKTGMICGPENVLNKVCYEISLRQLIRDGYLCPLMSKAGATKADTASLAVRGGEFIAGDAEKLMDRDALVEGACDEIIAMTRDRKTCLIFASGIEHGRHIVGVLRQKHGQECGFVCGDTPSAERAELLDRFRAGTLKFLANVNVLTTGFDAPNIDCVAILRPTMSTGLFVQMVGRGCRLSPGKLNCLILDFGGNLLRHGPIDQVNLQIREGSGHGEPPAKECPDCHSVVAAGCARCPDCGHQFPAAERQKHEAQASSAGVLAGQVTLTTYPVFETSYKVHRKRGAPEDAPRTMQVTYRVGFGQYKSEWICIEHEGYAREKAAAWWGRRSRLDCPSSAEEAVDLANEGMLVEARTITVRSVAGEPYERIVGHDIKPLGSATPAMCGMDSEDIPF